MGYFPALNQVYHPLEVTVIDDSPIIAGLLSIFPIEILRREEASWKTQPSPHHAFQAAGQWWETKQSFSLHYALFSSQLSAVCLQISFMRSTNLKVLEVGRGKTHPE